MTSGPIISLKNINIIRNKKSLLKNVSWNIHKNQHWAILGLNGAGKTTLLKILTCYLWPTTGTIDVLGNRYGKVNIHEVRRSIGWVSTALDQQLQDHSQDSALEIVLSGKYASIGLYDAVSEQDKQEAMRLLDKFNISHLAHEPLTIFSQGERKKVLLARAWMSKLKLLILDEPCAGLDIRSREEFLSTLEKLSQEEEAPTMIFVTHHVEEIISPISDILLLRQGEVIAAGKKEETLTEENLSATFDLPIQVHWRNARPWISV
ncbi:molybdenum ABC transporter ATP-binding protein [Salipaludibacillus keqinensis]|uniref:Molybdenum ABC transporter ATP-binding protein n=1 Tax=Salipaludibacillus keqinensis TaxID=2045207 RepID=A0A323TCE7_9BACI|nr:ABC transporter ATP-binding protein [Salipaludibacillus keqinensis]PYZ91894.1 molybdenum ABC transporter ATP-binding protein [Salipaludibacillus keqinensis]